MENLIYRILLSKNAAICSGMGILLSLSPINPSPITLATKTNSPVIEAPYEPDYAKILPERREWHRLKKAFLKKKLPQILRKYRDKLRCDACPNAYMDIAFAVNLIGSVTIRSIERQYACGGEFPEAMQQDFLKYLREYPYPKILLGKSVRLRLGTALQC